MDEWEVFPRVAAAAGLAAQDEGVARLTRSREVLLADAARIMRGAREAVGLLMRESLIAPPPAS
jgi:malate dehydrogenase (oxaloacetate-decarboxylating)